MSYELEKDHSNAIKLYEQAWAASYGNNPAIGYRLSQAYLNTKCPVEAIDICHKAEFERQL